MGSSVGISGSQVVISSIGDDDLAIDAGAAFFFDVPEPSAVALGLVALTTLVCARAAQA